MKSTNAKLLKTLQFEHPVRCHSFNRDLSRVAVAHQIAEFTEDCHEIYIYDCKTTTPKLLSKLTLHTSHIRDIDWAPQSNMIASCAADTTCYVWVEESPNNWNHIIVQSGLKFSATVCRWSPDENYVAIGDASGGVRVCSYVPSYNWYGEKRFKAQTSAILDIVWTGDSRYFAIACADRFFKIFCIDPLNPKPVMSLVMENYGFASSLAANAAGNLIALYSQDSAITIFDVSSGDMTQPRYKFNTVDVAPLNNIKFLGNDTLVCSSSDRYFYKIKVKPDLSVEVLGQFGEAQKGSSSGSTMSAMSKFQNIDLKGTSGPSGASSAKTFHTKVVTKLQTHANSSLSAASLDKKISVWSF